LIRALRNRRRWSILPAIVWLLTQLTMIAGPSASAGERADIRAGEVANLTFICTAAGLVAEPLDGWPAPDAPPSGPEEPVAPCKWCQAFGLGVLPLSPAGVIVRRAYWQPVAFSLASAPAGLNAAAIGFQSRAPPWIV
jgi:hypothetical protein